MLINISSDAVFISLLNENICVPRQNLEIQLPQIIYDLYAQKKIDDNLYVINGPGSFTNLRVGCLVLNMLKDFKPGLQLFTASKLDICKSMYINNLIPPQGIMYIGQQKNYWHIDFDLQRCEKVTVPVDEFSQYVDGPYWTDETTIFDPDHMVQCILTTKDQLCCSYKERHRTANPTELGFDKVASLNPNYIILPNISTPN